MRSTASLDQPQHYTLCICGHLDQRWADWFEEMEISWEGEDVTILQGCLPDQAALHGLLAKVRDLNLVLISVSSKMVG